MVTVIQVTCTNFEHVIEIVPANPASTLVSFLHKLLDVTQISGGSSMSVVLKLQKLSLTDIHSETDLGLISTISVTCPATGVGENSPFEME
jgi:hypothetical protein